MLAFDDETMFKTEFLFSDMNCSSPSFDDLGASPNDADNVMDQSLEALLFGSCSDDLIASQLQSSGREDCAGELADMTTSDDPHRTDSRAYDDDDDDGGDAADEEFAGRSASNHMFQVNTAGRSNRPDHDYVTRSSADEDDDEAYDQPVNDLVPQTGGRGRGIAADYELVADTVVAASTAKRSGLRSQPRKRCFSTSSTASHGSQIMPVTPRTGKVTKKRKLSGTGSTASRQRDSADKCMTKNAIMARENRQKKKEQFREMMDRLEQLEEENEQLRNTTDCQRNSVAALVKEVTYLRGVVHNTPEISALIQCIRKAPGIKDFRTSFGTSLRSNAKKIQDENQTPAATSAAATTSSSTAGKSRLKNPMPRNNGEKSGVCLHVVNGAVSLEFCGSCSAAAARSLSK